MVEKTSIKTHARYRRRTLSEAQKANFVNSVMRKPELQKWVLEHPRSVAKLLGWCAEGQDLAVDVSAALLDRGYLASLETQRIDLRQLTKQTANEERAMSDEENKQRAERKQENGEENVDVPEFLDELIEFGTSFAPPPISTLGQAIPWDRIFRVLEQAAEAKKERDFYKAITYAWEKTGGGKDILARFLWSETDPARRQAIWTALKPVLSQLQSQLKQARRKLEEGEKDQARRHLGAARDLLRQLRERLEQL